MTNAAFSDKTRLYVQLRPNDETLKQLQAMRDQLTDGRPVPDNELHMTVIHIGELSRLIASLPSIEATKILKAVEICANQLQEMVADYREQHFTLEPIGIEAFGRTIVVTYWPSRELKELHERSLQALVDMLRSIGIDDLRSFMESDSNLRYALTLRPHVSLVRSGSLPDETVDVGAGIFSLMKIVY